MTQDFSHLRTVTVKKFHQCYHCCRWIVPGQKVLKWAGVYAGDFYSSYEHEKCRGAWTMLFHAMAVDELPALHEAMDHPEDDGWLIDNYPEVAASLSLPLGDDIVSLDTRIRYTAAKHGLESQDRKLLTDNGLPPKHLRGK